ncbi:MAG: helix-turn-helix domain-containing protein [Candidatus Protistobacter heckmanni]|nr:helix-turn-helix domain-containing protein [Candidatus Protistobacter heckmanni]
MKAPDKNFSSTIGQGIALLRFFTATDHFLGNKELSERLDLPPSTVARLTFTLCELGLLTKVERHRK